MEPSKSNSHQTIHLDDMRLASLQEVAKNAGIEYYGIKKALLIERLLEQDGTFSRARPVDRKCKYGLLTVPVKDPSGRMRYCKTKPKSPRKSVDRKCKYGLLTVPVKNPSGRMRYCKKKPKLSTISPFYYD